MAYCGKYPQVQYPLELLKIIQVIKDIQRDKVEWKITLTEEFFSYIDLPLHTQ